MSATAGFDIAKEFHWLTVIDDRARLLLNHRVGNDSDSITQAVGELHVIEAEHGPVTVGLDVVGGIAGLLTAMLLAEGFACVHVPGLAVNRARRGSRGGENKSDPRDAKVIAEQVLLRDDLRLIELPDETSVELRLLVAQRTHTVRDITAQINRLRDLLTAIHPGLDRVVQPRSKASLLLLSRYVTPAEIRQAGAARIARYLTGRGVRQPTAQALAEAAVASACSQRTAVVGERRTARMVREFADELLRLRAKLKALEDEIEQLVTAHPDGALIRSLPGMGVALTAEFLAAVGSFRRFAGGDALAAASGLAPVMSQSGKVRYSRGATGGDKALKRVFYQSAFCAIKNDTASRTYYDRKRAEGKRHHQALIALARRRVNVLYAILRDRRPYQPRPPLHLVA
ncbi:IS110 family transposase [Streptomyces sp. LHD-70]|uniref:IS110 family transposase n=1 Tax=Streptomyces sp. LHD-70 TaxID=3072140 RepID=UPI00280FB1B5|nr:IS110 family transposase [Streptomyces sp. LHD-70]MDQ8703385.1 IS110 family transposase [Streptomyces sp. LHD-70]